MFPALKAGNAVIVCKYFFSKPKIRDIIAAFDPRDERIIIKRIIKIENNRYFAQGDNIAASTDSRNFGMIDKNNIIGKIVFVL